MPTSIGTPADRSAAVLTDKPRAVSTLAQWVETVERTLGEEISTGLAREHLRAIQATLVALEGSFSVVVPTADQERVAIERIEALMREATTTLGFLEAAEPRLRERADAGMRRKMRSALDRVAAATKPQA